MAFAVGWWVQYGRSWADMTDAAALMMRPDILPTLITDKLALIHSDA